MESLERETKSGLVEVCFVDTSYSNLYQSIPHEDIPLEDNFYILASSNGNPKDGSGKHRPSNYEALYDASNEILHTYPPGDVNIVVHSASGGTGSVAGPLLVAALTAKNLLVFSVMIGSTSSKIETVNTLKTIQTYAAMSQKLNTPIAAIYRENSQSRSRTQVDTEIIILLNLLIIMCSGNNRELDSEDIMNFKNFNKVTNNPPKLTSLEMYSGEIVLPKGQHVISVITLADNVDNSHLNIPVDYHSVGYTSSKVIDVIFPVHVCNITGIFNSVIESLNAQIEKFEAAFKLHVDKAIIDGKVEADEIGMVL